MIKNLYLEIKKTKADLTKADINSSDYAKLVKKLVFLKSYYNMLVVETKTHSCKNISYKS